MGVHAAENNTNAMNQPGLFYCLSPPFGPVKIHKPAHKRPLTTTGAFSFQPRLGTATNTRSLRALTCNAALCTSPPPDVVRARKPDT